MGSYTHIEDNNIIYSVSSIGFCERALWYDRRGITHAPIPFKIQRGMDEGTEQEDDVIALFTRDNIWHVKQYEELKDDGWSFGEYMEDRGKDYSKQVRVEKDLPKGVVLRGHLDGIAVVKSRPLSYPFNIGDQAVVEAKLFTDSLWSQYKRGKLAAFPKYQWQVSAQMHATGLPVIFIVGHKGSDRKVFEIDYEFVTKPPISLGQFVAKVLRIERALDADDELSLPCVPMFPCPFYQLHEEDVKEAIDVEADIVDSLAVRYLELQEIEKAGKEAADKRLAIRDQMLELMRGDDGKISPEKVLRGGEYEISDSSFWNAGRVSEEKLKADGIDVEKYKQGFTAKKVTVKKVGEKDGARKRSGSRAGSGSGERAAQIRGM